MMDFDYLLSLCVMLISILTVGCSGSAYTTTGPVDRSMDSNQPYIFSSDLTKSETADQLKGYLVSTGWSIEEEDLDVGVIAASKGLSQSEKLQTSALTEGLTGKSTAGQNGRVTFQINTPGDTTGVGFSLIKIDGNIKVAYLVEGGPADSAKVKRGDFIHSINGRRTDKMNSQQASALLSRTPGSQDTLQISSTADGSSREVVIRIGEIPSYTVVQMSCQIEMAVNEEGTFTTRESQRTGYAIRGHPAMVLHGRALHQRTDLKLESPAPSTLPEAQAEN
ncbi:S41 family peptidase [Salinibacter ruber]|jgi:hypothetical protein|uniref:S41 family peptidase n=1 Tax=Salinibacter ruber TaxID=146919 RepID=UPI0011AEFD90|nr:PDZ domain-containing protein [Salinibacter ruber]